jgi:hypothetical protein
MRPCRVKTTEIGWAIWIDPYLTDPVGEAVRLGADPAMDDRSFAQRRLTGNHQTNPNRSHTRRAEEMPSSWNP